MQAAFLLETLEKAVNSDAAAFRNLVPEDLEVQAHSTLWSETDAQELTLLKMLPTVAAKSTRHEYTRFKSYGYSRNTGAFGERSLPPETQFDTERVITRIKLIGEVAPVFLLAAMEQTQQALGTSGAVNINRASLRLNLLRKINRDLYQMDDTTHRDLDAGTRYKGVEQLIREGTDGTTGTSRYGSHVIDMQGDPLTPDTLRKYAARSIIQFGMFNTLIMDPAARGDFESELDAAIRLNHPLVGRPYMIGQQIGGLQTQGGRIAFVTDNMLTPIFYGGQYTTELVEGAPITKPTVSGAVTVDAASKFDANNKGAGDVFYIITEVVDEREGLGTRWPAGTAEQTVAVGEKVTLTVTAGSPRAHTFRVYRGYSGDADTEAYWIGDFSAPSAGSKAIVDLNTERPGTSRAFALRLGSASRDSMVGANQSIEVDAASFFKQEDRAGNTVSVATLGPFMGLMKLASLLAEVDRPLMYTAHAPQVKNPFQNFVFKNIGSLNG